MPAEPPPEPVAKAGRLSGWRRAPAIAGVNLVILAILLLGLELVGRIGVWYREIPEGFRPEPFHGIGQTDPVLWWRLQSRIDTVAQGVRVRTNARGFRDPRETIPPGTVGVYALGDSTTYGWGVEARQMYTAQAERLRNRGAARPAAVVSAGVPGYTSYQCLLQLRESILPLGPDVVTVLASNNECRARPLGDRRRGERLERLRRWDAWLGFSHFWRLVADRSRSSRRRSEADPPPGRVANTTDEYRANFLEIIRTARDAGAEVVVMTVPLRLRFEPTWKTYDHPSPDVAALLAQAGAIADPAARRPLLERAVALQPGQFEGHFRLARCLDELGRPGEAHRHYRLAREHDLHPETARPGYNQVLRDLCRAERVRLVDLEAIFEGSGLPEAALFLDHCHPSAEGHRLIGEALAKALKDVIGRRPPSGAVPAPPRGGGAVESLADERVAGREAVALGVDPSQHAGQRHLVERPGRERHPEQLAVQRRLAGGEAGEEVVDRDALDAEAEEEGEATSAKLQGRRVEPGLPG